MGLPFGDALAGEARTGRATSFSENLQRLVGPAAALHAESETPRYAQSSSAAIYSSSDERLDLRPMRRADQFLKTATGPRTRTCR